MGRSYRKFNSKNKKSKSQNDSKKRSRNFELKPKSKDELELYEDGLERHEIGFYGESYDENLEDDLTGGPKY